MEKIKRYKENNYSDLYGFDTNEISQIEKEKEKKTY